MWVSRTGAPPGCAVLTGAGLSLGRMPVLLLGCANPGNRQGWHSADTALPKVKFPLCPHWFLGCQVASCAQWLSLVSALDSPALPVPVAEPGLCSRAISWQIVPGVPCPAQMCLSLCASPVCHCASLVTSVSEPGLGGLQWVLRGRRCWHREQKPVLFLTGAAQSPAEGAPGWGFGRSTCTGGHHSGLRGCARSWKHQDQNRGHVASRFPYKKQSTLQCFCLTRRREKLLPSLLTVEIVALEKVWVSKNVLFRWRSTVWGTKAGKMNLHVGAQKLL